jgi:hypothetical protein
MFITSPSKGFTVTSPDEITHLTYRMRNRITELQASLSRSDASVINLRRRIAAVSRDRQRLDMDPTRCWNQQKRAKIQYVNTQTRLEVAMNELGVREDENYNLRRGLVDLKQKLVMPNRSWEHIEHSCAEQDIVKREKRQQKMVIAAAEMALNNIANAAVRSNLERLLENSEKSLTRLEVKRRM